MSDLARFLIVARPSPALTPARTCRPLAFIPRLVVHAITGFDGQARADEKPSIRQGRYWIFILRLAMRTRPFS